MILSFVLEKYYSEKRKLWWSLGAWKVHQCRPYFVQRESFRLALEQRKVLALFSHGIPGGGLSPGIGGDH